LLLNSFGWWFLIYLFYFIINSNLFSTCITNNRNCFNWYSSRLLSWEWGFLSDYLIFCCAHHLFRLIRHWHFYWYTRNNRLFLYRLLSYGLFGFLLNLLKWTTHWYVDLDTLILVCYWSLLCLLNVNNLR